MVENYFIYFPDRQLIGDPLTLGLIFEDIYFETTDGVRLHGWFVPGEGNITLLWCHGNAGNISHRLENLLYLRQELGVNVFMFDYRGYGRSDGRPSEKGLYLDAEAALRYLRSRDEVDAERIVYFGQSLGSAVVVELATHHPPQALMLESAFTSVPGLARDLYRFLPIWSLLRTKYDSLAKIGDIKVPVLIMHGDQDEIVSKNHALRLYEAADTEKALYLIPGSGHNDTYITGGADYFREIRRFLGITR